MRRATLGLVTAAGLLVAGCSPVPAGAEDAAAVACPEGSDCFDPIQPVGPGGEVSMDMGNFFFDDIQGTPVTGDVTVTVTNVSDAYHNAQFLGAADGSGLPEAEGGETGEAVVKLFPGEWTVICNVPGHRAAGMETTVTVYATEEEAAAAAEEAGTDFVDGEPEEGVDPTQPEEEQELPDADEAEGGSPAGTGDGEASTSESDS
ncbi:MAG: hypothetical protein WD378_07890 [Egicoccus sp.]